METTLGTQDTDAILLGAPLPIMSRATGVNCNLYLHRAPGLASPTAGRSEMLSWLLLVALLSAGCASRHYDVQLTDGSVFRSATKPKLTKEGAYLVRNDAGQSGSINTNFVQQIVPVSDNKSKVDANSTKTKIPSKSAKPSGKANFRNSFEFR